MDYLKITLIVLTVLSAISAGFILWIIRHPKTPRLLDFLAGLQLILFAAFFLGLLGDLRGLIPSDNEIKSGYDVALLIFPFFTAGIGTNILSNLVLSQRDYEGTLTVSDFSHKVVHWIVVILGIVLPPVLMGYAIYLKKYRG